MRHVSICCGGSFLGAIKKDECAEFGCNNSRGNLGKDGTLTNAFVLTCRVSYGDFSAIVVPILYCTHSEFRKSTVSRRGRNVLRYLHGL